MNDNKNTVPLSILAGVLASAIFLVFLFALALGLWLSLAAGVAGFIAVHLIFRKKAGEVTVHLGGGVSDRLLKETLEEGAARMRELEKYARMIENRGIREKVGAIREVVAKIYENFKQDPKDIKTARQFLSYHLDATIKIIRRYAELASRNSGSAEITTTLKKVESLLDTIKKAFEKQLDILLRDDVLDLDTEIKLMENTIKMEGLGD